jgi:endonuclease/exonuclease/phosphatase family metal-dependent hydrolase
VEGFVPRFSERWRERTRRASAARQERRLARERRPVSAYEERLAALEAATPYLACVHAPAVPMPPRSHGGELVVATYNVHRWEGANGLDSSDPARAGFVISELGADVIALQEVLRPFEGEDPLERLANAMHLYAAFVTTRVHRRGELGNAILSRWPIQSAEALDLSYSRVERRAAVAARFTGDLREIGVVATHLALVDRTRHRQVQALLDHPHLNSGPAILLGDMNSWRRKATAVLDRELEEHHNRDWPASFPAARPLLALDRIYARGARVRDVRAHDSAAARRASDHLPVVATVELKPGSREE